MRAPAAGGDIMQMFEGPGEETLDAQQREVIALAREAFRELEKLCKNIGLYGRGHQSVERFRKRLFDAVITLIADRPQFTFQIGPYDFTMFEQSVYQNPTPDRNFVYRFYLDGVRHIVVHAGVTAAELDAFVDVLLTDWEDPELFEDDTVTLMWQANFEHIQYVLIDNFDEDVQDGEERQYTVAGVIDQIKTAPVDGGATPPTPPRAGPPPPPGARQPVRQRERARPNKKIDLSGASLTHADLEKLVETPYSMDEGDFHTLERVIHTHGRETLEKFIEILFKVNLAEDARGTEHERAGRIVGLFDRIADLLLDDGRIGELERLMRKVRRLTGPRGERRPENLRTIERIFAHWSEPPFVERVLAPLLDAQPTRYLPSILAICTLLESTAVVPIAQAAGVVQATEAREHLFGLVARMLPGHERAVGALLAGVGAGHAHTLLRLLSTVGDRAHLPATVRHAMSNPEPKVRFEGLSVLPLDAGEHVLELLFSALDDPARMVRSKAIHLLARVRTPAVHARILATIDRKGFADFALDEKRRYFAAAALTGEAHDRWIQIYESGGLIRSKAQDEARHCAAVALAIRLQRGCVPAFEKTLGRRLKSEVVVEATEWALQHMQHDREERTRQLYDIFFQGTLTRAPVPEAAEGPTDG